jgi:DNA repair protein RecO (recombination protein O)
LLRNTQGIVLRSMDYGEGNKIISIFTSDLGKVGVMARGAKKIKSRHTAATQLFTYADFVFYKQHGQMGSLNQAEIIDAHQPLREDLYMSAYASYLVEMLERMLGDGEGGSYLFEQLKAGLSAIEEGKDMQIIVHIFEMKMIELAGYLPIIDTCVSCGAESPLTLFSAQHGGALCSRCRYKDSSALEISEGTRKMLKLFTKMDIRRLGTITVKEETKLQLKQCMRSYMDTHIGLKWKSRGFIEQMEKYQM